VCHLLSKFLILGKLNVLYESTARRDMQPLQDHVDVPVQLLILKRLCGLILLLENSAKGVKKVNLHFPLYLTSTWWTPRISGHNAKDEKKPMAFSSSSDLTCPRRGAELSAGWASPWPRCSPCRTCRLSQPYINTCLYI